MKDADWDDCISNSSSRKITPDKNRANSLRETAKERISLIKEITE